jgi:hypothetical protein
MQDITEVTDGAPFHNENSTTGRFQTYPSTPRHFQIVTAHTTQKELDSYETREEKIEGCQRTRIFQK